MNKEKVKNKVVNGCLIAIIGWSLFFAVMLAISVLPKTHTSFGDKEIEIIRKHMGITIDGNSTPVKLKETHGGGDSFYELWLEDIDDPEKFMENCYDGSYAVIEDKNDLQEFGGGFPYEYNYDDRLLFEDSYIVYTHAYDDGSKPSRYDYIIAFYKDGDSFKAKVVDAD